MSNTLVHFGPHDIRVIEDGTSTFEVVAKDVVEGIGATWNGSAAIAHIPDEWKGVRSVLTPGGMQEMAVLKEPGLYFYLGRSDKPAALPMQKWVSGEVLPSIRKTGSYAAKTTKPQTLSRNQVAASILLLRSAAEDLKLSPSAVLGGYQRLELQLGVTGLLPGYAVDASNSASGSSEETKSAAELLEIHGVGLSAIAFNRLLLQHGFIEERERPSSKGGTKRFKVCTNLEFGKNLTNPNNPRETQPHWYVRKFPDLLDLVIPAKPKAATA